MPRGVKGSGPKKDKDAEVEVQGIDGEQGTTPPGDKGVEEFKFPREDEERAEFDKGIEEFNSHVKALVQNFFQQEIAELEGRIRDLEMIIASPQQFESVAVEYSPAGPGVDGPEPYTPGGGGVEEYSPAHQGGDGTPWYTG